MTPLERHEKLTGPANENGCRLWLGALDPSGYGAFKLKGKKIGAHYAALLLRNHEIPTKMDVCHTCDVRACVNPAHLFVGTRQKNMIDARDKGRFRKIKPALLDKYGVDEVLAVVKRLGSLNAADRFYGTSRTTVRNYLEKYGVNPRRGLFQKRDSSASPP